MLPRFAWFHYTLIRYLALYDANHPTGIFEYIWLYTFFFLFSSFIRNTLLCVFNRFFFEIFFPWMKSCDVLPLKVLSKLVKITQQYNVFERRVWKGTKKKRLCKMHNSSSSNTCFLITRLWNWIETIQSLCR